MLNCFDNKIIVGGVPEPIGESALSFWHLRNSTSFKGNNKFLWLEQAKPEKME